MGIVLRRNQGELSVQSVWPPCSSSVKSLLPLPMSSHLPTLLPCLILLSSLSLSFPLAHLSSNSNCCGHFHLSIYCCCRRSVHCGAVRASAAAVAVTQWESSSRESCQRAGSMITSVWANRFHLSICLPQPACLPVLIASMASSTICAVKCGLSLFTLSTL